MVMLRRTISAVVPAGTGAAIGWVSFAMVSTQARWRLIWRKVYSVGPAILDA